jgi:hypothetical protein
VFTFFRSIRLSLAAIVGAQDIADQQSRANDIAERHYAEAQARRSAEADALQQQFGRAVGLMEASHEEGKTRDARLLGALAELPQELQLLEMCPALQAPCPQGCGRGNPCKIIAAAQTTQPKTGGYQ